MIATEEALPPPQQRPLCPLSISPPGNGIFCAREPATKAPPEIPHSGLRRRTAAYGHFGRAPDKDGGFSWEKTDLVEALKRAMR